MDKNLETQLQELNITDAALGELSKYKLLVIASIDDKEGQKAVKDAHTIVRRKRIDIEKKRKELNADALEFQRNVNAEAKRVTALLEPIETHLLVEQKKIEDEIERIKIEKEKAAEACYQARVKKLLELNFKFDGVRFFTDYKDTFTNTIIEIPVLDLKQLSELEFNELHDNAKHYWVMEQEKLAREDAERKEEIARLTQLRREQELENERLADIARAQAEKEAALKAEQERLEYEKSKEIVVAERVETSGDCPTDVTHPSDAKSEPTLADVNEKIIPIRTRIHIQWCIKQCKIEAGRQYAVDCFFEHLKQVIKREIDLDDFADLYCLNDFK